jgi:hypothetical protein
LSSFAAGGGPAFVLAFAGTRSQPRLVSHTQQD